MNQSHLPMEDRVYPGDSVVIKETIADIDQALEEDNNYQFAMNMPRLSKQLKRELESKNYTFTSNSDTGLYGGHSKNQTQFIINK